MKTIRLKRLKSNSMGTLGIMTIDTIEICSTMELPWVDAEHDGISDSNVSCIPDGVYFCKKIHSPTFGEVFEVQNVPGRSHILIHSANFQREIRGCIAVGMITGEQNGQYCIYKSKVALSNLYRFLGDDSEFCLEISS